MIRPFIKLKDKRKTDHFPRQEQPAGSKPDDKKSFFNFQVNYAIKIPDKNPGAIY